MATSRSAIAVSTGRVSDALGGPVAPQGAT
jgi:hypothetical protein